MLARLRQSRDAPGGGPAWAELGTLAEAGEGLVLPSFPLPTEFWVGGGSYRGGAASCRAGFASAPGGRRRRPVRRGFGVGSRGSGGGARRTGGVSRSGAVRLRFPSGCSLQQTSTHALRPDSGSLRSALQHAVLGACGCVRGEGRAGPVRPGFRRSLSGGAGQRVPGMVTFGIVSAAPRGGEGCRGAAFSSGWDLHRRSLFLGSLLRGVRVVRSVCAMRLAASF